VGGWGEEGRSDFERVKIQIYKSLVVMHVCIERFFALFPLLYFPGTVIIFFCPRIPLPAAPALPPSRACPSPPPPQTAGELVGARLIAHVGSLINLAKQPASTIQILGAEKALFRALKTKHETPKYGLIYHASLIGQASTKHKGKISRVLAAKCALGVRVDALGDVNDEGAVGLESRGKVCGDEC
jgi:hypothetical protein